jgi:hypothetical protein
MKNTTENLESLTTEFIGANIANNKRLSDYRLLEEQEDINSVVENIVDYFEVENEDINIENDICEYISEHYMTDIEYISDETGENTNTIKTHYEMYNDAMGNSDIKYFFEHYEDMDFYENYSLRELVDMAIEEWFIFGEGFDIVKVHTFLDYDKIWDGLLKYDITQVENGYVRIY